MPWQQLHLNVQKAISDDLEEWLENHGALSTTVSAARNDEAILEPLPGSQPLWEHCKISALFEEQTDLASIIETLPNVFDLAAKPQLEYLEDQEWERVCQKDFKPMQYGETLLVCPSWEEEPKHWPGVIIRLDPGLAFGTGTHPTTAMCLDWLAKHPPTQNLVIDYGCGSGILTLAALKLGARHVWSIDLDPQALLATEQNLEKNDIGVGNCYAVPPEGLPPVQADLLVANILASPLIELAPTLAQCLKPAGTLVLSGILDTQVEAVKAAYQDWMESWNPTIYKDGWACLSGQTMTI